MSSAAEIVKRLDTLKTLRLPHELVWRDCFDHSFPMRGSGLQSNTLTAQQALDRKARLVDSTSTDACRTLASALQAGMTPANARWFGLEVNRADDDAKRWLDDASEQLHQEIHNANFDSVGFECQLDMVGAGWFAMYVDVDRDNGGLHYEAWPIAQVFVSSTKPSGMVDTVYRNYNISAAQAVLEFGDACSELVKKKATLEPDYSVEMVHCIYPRTPYAVGSKMAKNMPFASFHVEVQQQHIVRESGYEEIPVIVPRWSLIPDTCYAVGPMFDALPDARMLNELKRMDYASADIAISGMWIAEDDGVLNPRTIKVGARKIIVANSVDSMKPLLSGSNWQLATDRIQGLQASIRKILMADQLQPQDGPAMTATEVHARIALLRQQLGPLFGRMQAEYLSGVINRSFMLAFRAGIFGPPPESLRGRSFSIKYISPLAKSQKLEEVSAIQQFNGYLMTFAEFKPEVLDVADFDAQAREMADSLGVPMSTVRTTDDMQALREARTQQQQAAQAQAQQQNIQSMAADAKFKQTAKAA
jgi:hypothetical protein